MGSAQREMVTERGRKFLVDVNWSLLSLLMLTATAVLVRIVLARWLHPAGFGLFSMVLNLQSLAVIVAGFGIPMALTKHVAAGEGGGVRPPCVLAGAAVLGAGAGGLLYLLAEPVALLYGMPRLSPLIALLAWGLPFGCFTEALLGLFNGLREMRSYAVLVALRSGSMLLCSSLLVLGGGGVEGGVRGLVLSAAATAIIGGFCARRLLAGGIGGFLPDMARVLRFGSRIFGSNAVSEIVNRADVLLVGYFLTASEVGFYSSASSVSALLLIIPSAIQKVSYPAASAYWSAEDHGALRGMVDRTMKYTACVLFPAGLATLFFGREILEAVFGAPYLGAYLPLCILLLPRVLGGATLVPVGSLLSGIGRPEVSLKIDSAVLVLNVVLNLLLIPRFGIAGAALALAAAQLCGYALALAVMVRVAGITIDTRWFAMAGGLAAGAVAAYLAASRYLPPALAALAVLSAHLLLTALLLLTGDDRRMLASLAHSMMSR